MPSLLSSSHAPCATWLPVAVLRKQPWVPLPHQQLGRQWGQSGTSAALDGGTVAGCGGEYGLHPQEMPEEVLLA